MRQGAFGQDGSENGVRAADWQFINHGQVQEIGAESG